MRHLFAFAVVCLGAAPFVAAQQYTGTLLYPLTTPSGMSDVDPSSAGVNGQTVGYGEITSGSDHALLWSGPNGFATDLNPAGSVLSKAYATDGIQQVGYASTNDYPYYQAMLWTGTAESAVDLNPAEYWGSIAYGISGNQQVGGGGAAGGDSHALLWSGTAASVVDLNPAGFINSTAFGIAGNQQVGRGDGSSTGFDFHALLWSGTASSAIDLNPVGFSDTEAIGIAGNQQVGHGTKGVNVHALLWFGTASSAVDLNPSKFGFATSTAEATNGTQQVGWGTLTNEEPEALLWSGTAASAVNLQLLLPSVGTWQSSNAYFIDANGNIFGTAYGALNNITGNYAVEWSPTPEPVSLSVLAIGALGRLRRRRPCR